MRHSSDLPELIFSMSPSEKRYFKRFASRHREGEKNQYVQLFDLISKQEPYSEEATRKWYFKDHPNGQFSVAKNDLYQLILRALRANHHGKSIELEIREYLDYIDLLMGRGLFEQAAKYCAKARTKAVKFETHFLLGDILQREMRLCKRKWGPEAQNELKGLQKDLKQVVGFIKNESKLRTLHDNVFPLVMSNLQSPNPAHQEEVAGILKEDVLSDEGQAHSWTAKLIFHYTHAFAARLLGNLEKVFRHYQRMVELWDATPHQVKSQPQRYLNTLMAYLDSALKIGETDEFSSLLKKINAVKSKRPDITASVFWISAHLKLRKHIDAGQHAVAKELLRETRQGLETHQKFIPEQVLILFQYHEMVLHLVSKDYRACLKVINQVLGTPNAKVREDIQAASRIFLVLVALEMPELDLLENYVRSSRRYFQNRDTMKDFEAMVLKYARELDRQPPGSFRKKLLYDFQADLSRLQKETNPHLGIEQVLVWIQQKV